MITRMLQQTMTLQHFFEMLKGFIIFGMARVIVKNWPLTIFINNERFQGFAL